MCVEVIHGRRCERPAQFPDDRCWSHSSDRQAIHERRTVAQRREQAKSPRDGWPTPLTLNHVLAMPVREYLTTSLVGKTLAEL